MGAYFVSYKNNPANKNSSVRKTKQNRLIFSPNCAVLETENQILLKIKKLVG